MKLSRVLTVLVFMLGMHSASAASRTWFLQDVVFDDGATAIGSVVFDAELALDLGCVSNCSGILDWNIEVSGGDVSVFPSLTYDPVETNAGFGAGLNQLVFEPLNSSRFLLLRPVSALTDAGGTVTLLTGTSTASRECYNCSPFRMVTGGALTTVPLPAGVILFASGCLGLVGVGWRRRRGLPRRCAVSPTSVR